VLRFGEGVRVDPKPQILTPLGRFLADENSCYRRCRLHR
jgi:hypothetical protein